MDGLDEFISTEQDDVSGLLMDNRPFSKAWEVQVEKVLPACHKKGAGLCFLHSESFTRSHSYYLTKPFL